jgi:hypothetical protein
MTLPPILAGPILRRAEPGRVSVWLATSFDPSPGLALKIFQEAAVTKTGFLEIATVSSSTTIRAGDQAYVSLVSADPDAKSPALAAFPTNVLLAYQVWLTRNDLPVPGSPVDLREVVEAWDELCYEGLDVPTFYLQDGPRLVLAHGSCRKPHGDGTDAMPAADTLIGLKPRDLERRPCMLCMTGDQIYANSVHGNTLGQIHAVVQPLFGYDEQIPTDQGLVPLKTLADVSRKSKRPGVAKQAGLNPDEWPLFGLGEMIVMYFLAWHSSLWAGFESAKPALTKGSVGKLLSTAQGFKALKRFVKALPAVTRAMANAAVYMIFDDHEVTDDWNLYKEWTARVRKSELGRRMVTNALVAYWLCQGWGNDPSRFDATFVKNVQDYCDLHRTNKGKVSSSAASTFENMIWDFHDWAFVTPTTPPVFFLDTRTWRDLKPKGRAPRLLSADAWRSFLGMANIHSAGGSSPVFSRATVRQGDPLVIVAPTPVFGMLFTEAKDKMDCLDDGPEGPDFEHWRFNQLAHHEFVKGLIDHFRPRYGVFLSGDVHTSFTAEVDYILQASAVGLDNALRPSAGDRAGATRFYQFTSSPLKNQNESFGAQIDTMRWPASEVMSFVFGIEMWETWDLVGYDRLWRTRAIEVLQRRPDVQLISQLIPRILYVQFMDGQAPDDPFVTMSGLVALALQELKMGRPLWREVGGYYRHVDKDSDDAPMYPWNNIGYVAISQTTIIHEICVVKEAARLLPAIRRHQYASTLPK